MHGRALLVRLAGVIGLLAVAWLLRARGPGEAAPPLRPETSPGAATATRPVPLDGSAVNVAYQAHRSGVEVEASGVVVRRLKDDTEGARHERFILRVGTLTVLVAHNIDLAPSVPVSPGDTLELLGEYEWNQLGGVIHWTHRDPEGRHPTGWIRLRGKLYQ
ncbi:MAG TPA: DUF3465 domain-containing protein [Gemmatimonadales bacterium]|jgi:hypothetical protein